MLELVFDQPGGGFGEPDSVGRIHLRVIHQLVVVLLAQYLVELFRVELLASLDNVVVLVEVGECNYFVQ